LKRGSRRLGESHRRLAASRFLRSPAPALDQLGQVVVLLREVRVIRSSCSLALVPFGRLEETGRQWPYPTDQRRILSMRTVAHPP
jgi:hypothetical protein